jgi:hypothetical protein
MMPHSAEPLTDEQITVIRSDLIREAFLCTLACLGSYLLLVAVFQAARCIPIIL